MTIYFGPVPASPGPASQKIAFFLLILCAVFLTPTMRSNGNVWEVVSFGAFAALLMVIVLLMR